VLIHKRHQEFKCKKGGNKGGRGDDDDKEMDKLKDGRGIRKGGKEVKLLG